MAALKQNGRVIMYASNKLKSKRRINEEALDNVNSSKNETIEDSKNHIKIQGHAINVLM